MTSKDEHNMHNAENDVEFADFLQGRGELAHLLQELPQEQPSAELDAAILADAEKALAAPHIEPHIGPQVKPQASLPTSPISVMAANDSIGPATDAGGAPSFLWRWELPLGLAAGILFAMPLALLQKQPSSLDNSAGKAATELPQLAKADHMTTPEAPAAAAPAPDVAQKPIATAIAGSSTAEMAKTKNTGTGSNRENARQVRETSVAQVQPPHAVANPNTREPVVAAAPPMVVAATSAEAAPAAITGTVQRQQYSESAPPVQAISEREHTDETPKTIVASKEEAVTPKKKFNESLASPPPMPAAIPPMAKSAPEVSLADKQEAQVYTGTLLTRRAVPASPPAMPATPAAPPQAAGAMAAPKDWLQTIDKLLKADRNKEALEEWKKFRLAYPDYTVNKSLQNQIDALQK